MELLDAKNYGYGFVSGTYLPPGKDEYWIRNVQAASIIGEQSRRALNPEEIAALERNGCRSGNWGDVLVSDPFDPALVRNTSFYGLVRLGKIEYKLLKHHDFCVPVGIQNSVIVSCDIGGNVAIRDCALISHYIIAPRCILSRVDELVNTNHAKYGNGILKEGESEDVRVWIDVMNEFGGRSILPFADMIPADAYLWAAFRDDTVLTEKLTAITQKTQGIPRAGTWGTEAPQTEAPSKTDSAPRTDRRGFYGTIGTGTVIKSCHVIKDTAIGEAAYIKGANKLKNLSILSSEDEATQIGEGVELVNGIVGYGCHVFYGAKAVRFVLGRRSSLKYGARLIHSVLGDNSTVSCCEILNNLVFPIHEQHHNNSFLIASLVGGMCNMAAGATVGSNHNSRANDGEIRAGRGFWPGLAVSLKHNSRFASFCLIAKGNFPHELDIPLPFSLVSNNVRKDRLEVMPAYFWLYNLYALERNSWKSLNRDKRFKKIQHIETEYLAPDTAEEMIRALALLEFWMKAAGGMDETETDASEYNYHAERKDELILAKGFEGRKRKTAILKPRAAAAAYRDMLFLYAMKTLIIHIENTMKKSAAFSFEALIAALAFVDEAVSGEALAAADKPPPLDGNAPCAGEAGTERQNEGRVKAWINLGGQIVPAFRVDAIRNDIREGRLTSWEAIHARYDAMAASYEADKARHALAVFVRLCGEPARETFITMLEKTARLSGHILTQVKQSRAKDFTDHVRSVTYRNWREMNEVVGKLSGDAFVRIAEQNHHDFVERIEKLREKLN